MITKNKAVIIGCIFSPAVEEAGTPISFLNISAIKPRTTSSAIIIP